MAVPPARPSPPRGTPAAPHAPTARISAGTGSRRHGPTPPLPSALGVQPLPAPIALSPVRKLRFTPSKRDLRWELSSDGEDGGEESEAEQEGEGELGLAALMRQALCVKKARRRASIASSQSSEGQGDRWAPLEDFKCGRVFVVEGTPLGFHWCGEDVRDGWGRRCGSRRRVRPHAPASPPAPPS